MGGIDGDFSTEDTEGAALEIPERHARSSEIIGVKSYHDIKPLFGNTIGPECVNVVCVHSYTHGNVYPG